MGQKHIKKYMEDEKLKEEKEESIEYIPMKNIDLADVILPQENKYKSIGMSISGMSSIKKSDVNIK